MLLWNLTMPNKGSKNNNNVNAAMEEMKKKLSDLEKKVVTLEDKVVLLEAHKEISEIVTKKLSDEVNKLSQYTRRSNIIVSNVLKPEDESDEEVVQKMHNLIKTEFKGNSFLIDKLHHTGKVKTVNGKKLQDIVIWFKSLIPQGIRFIMKEKWL